MAKVVGALLVIVGVVAGAVGVLWVSFDAIGTEWDYCPGGTGCIAGWKMGAGFVAAGAVATGLGIGLVRPRERGGLPRRR